jgi:hypothetical protein
MAKEPTKFSFFYTRILHALKKAEFYGGLESLEKLTKKARGQRYLLTVSKFLHVDSIHHKFI